MRRRPRRGGGRPSPCHGRPGAWKSSGRPGRTVIAANVEIKARVADPAALEERVRALADAGPVTLVQEDLFFGVGSGRLKVRRLSDGRGELIAYDRADEPGPKACRYELVATPDARGMAELLSRALPLRGEVRKTRRLYLAGRTRIHLDSVEGLGDFVELEIVLSPGEDPAAGRLEAERLMAALGVRREELVAGAYVDLLANSP